MTDAQILPVIVWTAPAQRIPAHLKCVTERPGVVVCPTLDRICDLLESHRVGVVVWDVASFQNTQLARSLDRLHRSSPDTPVLLYVGLDRHTARLLTTLASLDYEPRLVLRGFDNLAAVLNEVDERTSQPAAHLMIARHLLPSASARGKHLVAAAIVAGHRRVSPHDFSALCGLSRRTLEWHLYNAHLPPPRRLLGVMLVLHGLWRLDYLGWSTKRVAHYSGFVSSHSWGNFVQRHAGGRPTDLLAEGGFDTCVLRAARQLHDRARGDDSAGLASRLIE